jgi:hypothetical protein
MKDIFAQVISMITSLVKRRLQRSQSGKAVILVGGFRQSPYLRNCIQQVVCDKVEVIQPPNGWSAIARGASLKSLHDTSPDECRVIITARKARQSYSVKISTPYQEWKHRGRPKYDCTRCLTILC